METPKDFGQKLRVTWAFQINNELSRLRQDFEKATPVYTGGLQKSWVLDPFDPIKGRGSLSTFVPYFSNVEAGLPKGYAMGSQELTSLEGWVMAKMRVPFNAAPKVARSIALKYRAVGRPGQSYAGAAPKAVPSKLGQFASEPIRGGLIDQAFRRLDKEFR